MHACRDMMAASQMTVPETPSPEVLANSRRARRPLASFQTTAAPKATSNPVRSLNNPVTWTLISAWAGQPIGSHGKVCT